MAKKKAVAAFPSSDRDWEISRAADTLLDVQRIKKDPKLHKAALAELRRRRDEADKALAQPGKAGPPEKK